MSYLTAPDRIQNRSSVHYVPAAIVANISIIV